MRSRLGWYRASLTFLHVAAVRATADNRSMEIVLVVIGAVIGAAATGGVQAWDAWRTRRLRRMVAARVILGDLFVTEQMLELVLERKAWPDRVDLDAPIDTWRQFRAEFAAGVSAWEWSCVDHFYNSLHRTGLMLRPGEPCIEDDLDVAAGLLDAALQARKVVAPHVAPSRRERSKLAGDIVRSADTSESD